MGAHISPKTLLGAAVNGAYNALPFGVSGTIRGKLSVNGWIGKIARFAVSKAAAFFYAVAVGVAGNLAFHFVQPHDPAPAAITATQISAPSNARPAEDTPAPAPAGAAGVEAAPAATALPAATRSPPRPAPSAAVATAPILPTPPPPVALPGANSLPVPALKPAALPPPPPSEASLRPEPAPASVATDETAPVSPPRPAAAVLSPLSPAIEVATPPMPPALPASTPAPAAAVAAKEPPGGLAISDIWHPGRAIDKSLHWAGRQVPLIGDADNEPRPAAAHAKASAPLAAPISLLPPAGESAALDSVDPAVPPRKPGAPGPGSGGLY